MKRPLVSNLKEAWLFSLRIQGLPVTEEQLINIRSAAKLWLEERGYSDEGLEFKSNSYKEAIQELTGLTDMTPVTYDDLVKHYVDSVRQFWNNGEQTFSQISCRAAGGVLLYNGHKYLDDPDIAKNAMIEATRAAMPMEAKLPDPLF